MRNFKTEFGPVSFTIESQVAKGIIQAVVRPPSYEAVPVKLRLRHPAGKPLKTVTVNGAPWLKFDAKTEMIELPAVKKELKLVARY